MTRRNTQFTATVPTNSTPAQPKKLSEENPLSAFFRKSKFSFVLPSRGKWYPNGSLVLNDSGLISVYAMTAGDDIKFRTGDATMTGRNIYEIIQSCIPNIKNPETIPHIDIDALLLAIRIASYGDEFDFSVSVPNTTLTRIIKINGADLINTVRSNEDEWDEEISIIDETGQCLNVTIHPIPLKSLFQTSKNIYLQRKNLSKNVDSDQNIKDDATFTATMNALTTSAIDLLSSSIQFLKITSPDKNILVSLNAENPQDAIQIKQIINQIDIEYFNAIRDHIDNQRKKYQFMTPIQESTAEELKAGAPLKWTTELTFMGSNFLPEQKSTTSII